MERGVEGRSMGEEGSGRMDRNMRTGERFDRGDGVRSRPDIQPGRGGSRSRDDQGATGASEGEAGRDRMDRGDRGDRMDKGERSERRGKDAKGSDDKAERRARGSEGASEGETGRDHSKTGERSKESRDRDGDRGAERRGRDADRGDRGSEGASGGAEGKGKPTGSLTRLDSEKRTEVQSVFRSHESEAIVRDIDIDVRVGVVVPRSVTLHAVPAEVIVLVPDYRAYRYFIYDDQVIVVDPDTLEIVDVLVLA